MCDRLVVKLDIICGPHKIIVPYLGEQISFL